MDTQSNDQPKSSLLRAIAIGAAALAGVTAPGTCFCLYRWIATGNSMHVSEAVALISVAMVMGGSGGGAYHLVMRSRIKNHWKQFLAVLAAIEAYLLTFLPMAAIINLVAPKLNEGMPMDNVWFCLLLNVYGVLLCVVSFGVYYAPRIVQFILLGILVATILLSAAGIFTVLFMGLDDLDRLATFLWPVQIGLAALLVGIAATSVVGWVRFFRRPDDRKESVTT